MGPIVCKSFCFLAALLIFSGCASAIRVEENSPKARRAYGVTDYSAGTLSTGTVNLLGNFLLTELYENDPARVLSQLEQLFKKSRMPEVLAALADTALQAGYRYRAQTDMGSRYFLAAAVYSSCYLKELDDPKEIYDEQRLRMIRINNLAVTELFFYLKSRNLERRSGFEVPMPGSSERQVRFTAPDYTLPVPENAIRSFIPCANYRTLGLTHDTRIFGLGVPLVAELKPGMRDVGGEMVAGLPIAVTLVGDFNIDPATFEVTAKLRYIYSRVTDKVRYGKRLMPLAADFSTPLASIVAKPQEMNFIERTVKVAEAARLTGLYHLEPYDESRIPVIFVHGLMSDAKTWSQMLNTLLHDPVLRKKYQFLGFAYSSGNPIFVSGADLRRELNALREKLVKQKRSTAAFDQMVLVGHSMGGLLSRLQISASSEEQLFRELKIQDGESLKKDLSAEERRQTEALLNFKPGPFIKRVIFIAVPHRGSEVATSLIGRTGASLIRLPAELVRRNIQVISSLIRREGGDLSRLRVGTGIDNLRPDDIMLLYLNKLEMASHVPYHSIIGNRKARGIPGGSDGIVAYSSSHLDGAVSELVVKSGHSVQQNALAIQEVRRILLLHLKEMKNEEKKR